MASYGFFAWFFGIILSFIAGGVIFAGLYFGWSKLHNWYLKRKMPKDAKTLLNPGKPDKLNPQEVKENDRKQSAKFREFEKLRRTATIEAGKPSSKGIDATTATSPTATGPTSSVSERSLLQSKSDSSTSGAERESKEGFQLIEPTDISD